MGSTVSDEATKDTIVRIEAIINKTADILKERQRRQEEKRQYQLNQIGAKQQAKLWKELTENYKKDIRKVTYDSASQKLGAYVCAELAEYNRTHPKDKVAFVTRKNERGQLEILTNQKGVDKMYELRMKFALEHGGKVGEIPPYKFEQLAKNKNIIVLKNISSEQYNFIARKSWSNKNQISYTALKNADGTYDMAVIARDYMSYNKHNEDIYTALVTEKLIYDKNRQDADKYEKEMEGKIFDYSQNEPMYIVSARSSGQYIKVEKDAVTIMRPDGDDIIIKRPEKNASLEEQKAFAMDVYGQLDKISEPLIVGPETQKAIERNGYSSVEEALDDHARNGRDDDFVIGKTKAGIELYERPIVDETKHDRTLKTFAQKIAHTYRDEVCRKEAAEFTKQYADAYIKNIQNSSISEESKQYLMQQIPVAIENEFADNIDAGLTTMNRKQLNEMAENIINSQIRDTISNISLEDAHTLDRVIDKTNRNLAETNLPKLTQKRKFDIEKQTAEDMKSTLLKATSKEVDYKDLNGYAKSFSKLMKEPEFTPAFIDIGIQAAVEANSIAKESIYLTPESSLADILTNNLNANEKANYNEANKIHDNYADAKSQMQADKQMGLNDVIRSKHSDIKQHKDYTEKETTEEELTL